MAPSRRAAAASKSATRVKKLASSSKPSTKAKAKASSKRSRNEKDVSKSNARLQAVKQAAPIGSLAGGSSNASGHNNGRKSNSQRAAGVTAKNAPRRTTAAKSCSQVQPQRNSGRKLKTQRLSGVSAKSAPLKPTRRFNADAAGNRKQTQNSKKTKSTIKVGRQAGTAKQQPRKVHVQSKENGLVKAPLVGKAKKEAVLATKSAGKTATPRAGRKSKAPEEDPAIMGDENVEMLATDTRVEPVRLPLVKTEGSLYKCCVPGCPSTDDEFFTGLWLFALPTDEEVRTIWLEKIHVDPEINRPLSPRVCFQHFKKEDFVARNRCFIGLSGSALPRDIPRHMYRY